MSIVPASSLSRADLELLGNNVRPGGGGGAGLDPAARRKRQDRRLVAVVNRSLSSVGEQVGRLYRRRVVVVA